MGLDIDKYNERHFVELLNNIIKEAIEHGGDSGGAYLINEDGLIKAMRWFLNWTGLHETVGIMDENGWIRFFLKKDIVEEKSL